MSNIDQHRIGEPVNSLADMLIPFSNEWRKLENAYFNSGTQPLLMIPIQEEKNRYYFACGLLWWVNYALSDLLEEMNSDGILGNLPEDEMDEIVTEELASWLFNEMKKPGLSFQIDNKKVSVFACIEKYDSLVDSWMKDIESASKIGNQEIVKQQYYFYYLAGGWLLHTIAVFDDFVKSLQVPDLIQSYLNASPDFENLRQWLQEELSSVASHFLEEAQLEASKPEREKLYEQLANTWRSTVIAAASQYCPRRAFE